MNIFDKAASFAKSALVFVKAGMPCVSEDVIRDRLGICSGCERHNPDGYSGMGECRECGCNMEIKSIMATEKCPLSKW